MNRANCNLQRRFAMAPLRRLRHADRIARNHPAPREKSEEPLQFRTKNRNFRIKYNRPMQVKIEESWRSQLQEEFDKPYFARLAAFVREEYRTQRVCPVNGDLFRVFNLCPFDRVRVVILGQDPYPDPRFYYGICFSVPDGVPIPGSLQNIFREVHDDTGRPVPASGRLERWVAQGVLSMNTIFTTRAFRSGSHRGRGWEEFSDAVIRRLNERRDHLVFLLWGAAAQQKAALIDPERHLVLTAAHPSPRSADRGFFGCRHFSRANAYLRAHGIPEIEW